MQEKLFDPISLSQRSVETVEETPMIGRGLWKEGGLLKEYC